MIWPGRGREGESVTLYPLLITRIAALLTFGWLPVGLMYGLVEESASNADPTPELLITVLTIMLVGLLVYLTWRAWRHGVKLTPSFIIIQGIFYDRKIPISSIEDVDLGSIFWSDRKGRQRASLAIAFAEFEPLVDFVRAHNQRSLERIRQHVFTGTDTIDNQQWISDDIGSVDDRAYDRPEMRRPRRSDSGKRSGPGRRLSDAWPSVLLLTALVLGSTLGLLLTVGPALYLYDFAPTPGAFRLRYSNNPYDPEEIWDLVTLLGPLTLVLTGSAARLAYLMFRPPPRR